MFKRKLCALSHNDPNSFNIDDEGALFNLVLWLEDQKIRHHKIEDREPLRSTNPSLWQSAFKKYLEELGCPYNVDQKVELVDWLLGYAIRLEYGDNVDKYKNKENAPSQSTQQSASTNPLEGMDFESADFKAGVSSLATLLSVPPHHDHSEVCKAVCKLVTERLSKEVLQKSGDDKTKKEMTALHDLELGFDAGDYISNDAAKILRLLHIKNLRDVQTKVNEAIVAVQTITADPKTDQRLGKVGR